MTKIIFYLVLLSIFVTFTGATLKDRLDSLTGRKSDKKSKQESVTNSTNTAKAPVVADPPQKSPVLDPPPKPAPVLMDESKELAYEYFTGVFREKAFKSASSKRKSPNVTAFEVYMSRLCHIDEPKQYSFNPREKKLRFVEINKLDEELHDKILKELKTKLGSEVAKNLESIDETVIEFIFRIWERKETRKTDNRSIVLMTYTELLLLMGSVNEHKHLDEMARLSREIEKHNDWMKWSHLKMWTQSPGMIDRALEVAARKGPVDEITKSFDAVVGPVVEAVVQKKEIHEILEQVMKVSKTVALYVQEVGNENAASENKEKQKLASELWHYFRDSDNGNVLTPNHKRPNLSEPASHSFVRWMMNLPEEVEFKDALQLELNANSETSEMLKYVILQLIAPPYDKRDLNEWKLKLDKDPCTDKAVKNQYDNYQLKQSGIEKDTKKMALCKRFRDEILAKVKTFGDTNIDAGKKKVAFYVAEIYLRLSEAYPEQVKDLRNKQNRTQDENDQLKDTPGRVNRSRKRALNLVNVALDLEEKENDAKDRFR